MELMPHLEKMEGKRNEKVLEIKGKVKYYKGKEGILRLWKDTMKEADVSQVKEHLNFGHNYYHRFLLKEITADRLRRNIFCKTVQPDDEFHRSTKRQDSTSMRKTILIPRNQIPKFGKINITDSSLNFYGEEDGEPIGIKIYNRQIVQVLSKIFNFAWKYLEHDVDK